MSESPSSFENPIYHYDVPLERLEIPKLIKLNFKKSCIRAHKDENLRGFMFFTLYLPEKREDQGFVWEEPFNKVIDEDWDDSMYEKNSISSNYLKSVNLDGNINLSFTFIKNKSRKGLLTLTLTIKGTPFIGDKLLEERFYKLI